MNFPDKYQNDLKVVRQISANVEKTHKGLEKMDLFSILSDLGNRCSLICGVASSGKSQVAYHICRTIQDVADSRKRNLIATQGLTLNGLKYFAEQLDGNSSTIIIEDLAQSGTEYMQVATVSVLAGLVYSHSASKHNQVISLDIRDAWTSALIYAQPLILGSVVGALEFDSNIKDKCLRYYHLFKPKNPSEKWLSDDTNWKLIQKTRPVKALEIEYANPDEELVKTFEFQVNRGRALEHSRAFVQASALLNGRSKVSDADFWLVKELCKCLKLEQELYNKKNLEGASTLDPNTLPLLTSFNSGSLVTLKSIGKEYRLSESRTRVIIDKLGKFASINNGIVYPTDYTKHLLKEMT